MLVATWLPGRSHTTTQTVPRSCCARPGQAILPKKLRSVLEAASNSPSRKPGSELLVRCLETVLILCAE